MIWNVYNRGVIRLVWSLIRTYMYMVIMLVALFLSPKLADFEAALPKRDESVG